MLGVPAVADDGRPASEALLAELQVLQGRAQTLEDPDERAEVEGMLHQLLEAITLLERVSPTHPARAIWRRWVGPPYDPEAYFVVRWFKLGGDRAEPGEIISSSREFWRGRYPPIALVGMGTVVLLNRSELAWMCSCHRFWRDPVAWVSHGCSEPPVAQSRQEKPASEVYVPSQHAVLTSWRSIWLLIKPRYKTEELTAIVGWLHRTHPSLERGPKTLRRIIRAGEAGKLD